MIALDFALASRQAASLEEQAARLRKLARQQYGGTLENVAAAWKGQAASGYVGKGRQLQSSIEATAAQLDAAAQAIRATVRRLYDAEQEAKRVAEERSYR